MNITSSLRLADCNTPVLFILYAVFFLPPKGGGHMRYIVLFLSSLFMVESVFTNAVAAVSLPSLSSAMNQRLLVMKDVAGYKAEHHLPVEDLVREQKVMSLAREEATAAGLEPQSVVPFIQAQMDVAKAIQYRYLADWLSRPEKTGGPETWMRLGRLFLTRTTSYCIRSVSAYWWGG